jgi:HSP20 family molecular chaperone IbpA
MNEDMQDMFRQVDAMMASMMAQMRSDMMEGMQQPVSGYHLIIHTTNGMPEGMNAEGGGRSTGSPLPDAEVHRIGSEVKVVAELPGADGESIRLDLQEGALTIEADGLGQHYHKTAVLPPVEGSSMHQSFKNGVLEVTFTIPPDKPEKEASSA